MDDRDRRPVGFGALGFATLWVLRNFWVPALTGLGIKVVPGGHLAVLIAMVVSIPSWIYASMALASAVAYCWWHTIQTNVPRILTWIVDRVRASLRERPSVGLEKRIGANHIPAILFWLLIFGIGALIGFRLEPQQREAQEYEQLYRNVVVESAPQRSLSEQQRAILIAAITPLRRRTVNVVVGGLDPETADYARQFYELFKQNGMDVGDGLRQIMYFSFARTPRFEVSCAVDKRDSADIEKAGLHDAQILRGALVGAGLLGPNAHPVSECDRVTGGTGEQERGLSLTVGPQDGP